MTRRRLATGVLLALWALGYVLPFWPLLALAVALLALSGRWVAALVAGLLLDVLWGVPLGWLQPVYLPFTVLAIAAALARAWGGQYFIDRAPRETL
jgi:hypothetical protein